MLAQNGTCLLEEVFTVYFSNKADKLKRKRGRDGWELI